MEKLDTPPRKKSGWKIWWILLLVVCFFFSAAAGVILASSNLFDLKKDPIQPIERMNFDTELIKARDKSTVLIMGVDVRKDDTGRSDTMMVATVDPKFDRASLMSIPRDTRVRIYGYGFDKINAAFAYGGEPLAEKTVENFLGIDIDHYIIVDVKSFVKIIDAIGGIDINVEKRMKYEDPWDDNGGLYINIFPGKQHMDGKKAVTYVRYRDSEGDIGRIERQQKFIQACMDKVMSPSFIPRIPAVIREVSDAIDTDMTVRQLMELAGALKAAKENGLETDMVPGYPLYIDNISYWIPYVDELQYSMARLLDVSVDSKIKQRAENLASEYNDSIPSNARSVPDTAEPLDDDYDPHLTYENAHRPSYDDTPSQEENYSAPAYNDYPEENYSEPAYNDYPEENYSTPSYDDTPSREENYSEPTYDYYPEENYSEPAYNDYREENYSEPAYNDYHEENYSEPTYDDRYEENYSEPTYDNGYEENYSEQSYDDSPGEYGYQDEMPGEYYYDAPARDETLEREF